MWAMILVCNCVEPAKITIRSNVAKTAEPGILVPFILSCPDGTQPSSFLWRFSASVVADAATHSTCVDGERRSNDTVET